MCQSCRWPAVTTLRPSDTAGSARSGFAVSATQLAMPDAGLISYAEMLTIGKNICDAPWPEKPGFLCSLSIGFYVLFYDSKFNRGTPSPVGHVWNLTSSLESHATLLCTIYWLERPNFNFVLIELAHSRGFYFIPQKRAGTQPKQQFNIFSTRKPAEYIYIYIHYCDLVCFWDLPHGNDLDALHQQATHGKLLVIGDGDTGFGGPGNIRRTLRGYAAAGFAGISIEDQVYPKRCSSTRLPCWPCSRSWPRIQG